MTVLIVEDEAMSRVRLARNIGARFPDLTIVGMTDSVASTLFSAMGHPFQQLAEMILRSSVTSGSSLV